MKFEFRKKNEFNVPNAVVDGCQMEGKVIPVRVAVRSRPMVDKEVNEGCQSNIMFVPNEPQLVIGKDKAFTFDFVYSPDSTQDDVYRNAVVPLVTGLFRGPSHRFFVVTLLSVLCTSLRWQLCVKCIKTCISNKYRIHSRISRQFLTCILLCLQC